MPIVITLYVSSPASVLLTYDKIKIYRSDYSNGVFTEITDASTRLSITTASRYYNYEDVNGTSSSYYKTSYYNSSTLVESSLSSATQGILVEDEFYNSSYPAEISLTSTDSYTVDKIRFYTGDEKSVKRDYVSPVASDGYFSVSTDGYSYTMSNRGWPLQIIKDGVEYTSKTNPFVTDYSYITFSGTQISTTSGTLDVWFNSFRHSDREILKIYTNAPTPPGVSSTDYTTEMRCVVSSIQVLESEMAQLMGETTGSFTLQGELSYNPDPLLKHKKALIDDLKKKLDDLVEDTVSSSLTGVRID